MQTNDDTTFEAEPYTPSEPTGARLFAVAIYETTREYGGPEEGGWWFDDGELIRVAAWFHIEQNAIEHTINWNEQQRAEDRANRIWSGDSRFEAHVVQIPRVQLNAEAAQYQSCYGDHDPEPSDYETRWDVPTHFPEARPFYC